jgi:hypothetical protein
MKTYRQWSPLVNEPSASGNEIPVEKTKARKKMIPGKDDDFGDVCETVNESWKQNPDLTLRFITQPEFEVMVNTYNGRLGTRQEAGGGRPTLTGQLEQADADIDNGLGFVKLYLKKKYEKSATDHYAAFGIVRVGRGYELPANREKRKNALKQIVKQIVTEGFTDEKYGKQFWNDMNKRYNDLLKAAKSTDSTVSDSVGDKNLLKEKLTQALNSLIGIIIYNMPDTYPAELRKWGFQKEKY